MSTEARRPPVPPRPTTPPKPPATPAPPPTGAPASTPPAPPSAPRVPPSVPRVSPSAPAAPSAPRVPPSDGAPATPGTTASNPAPPGMARSIPTADRQDPAAPAPPTTPTTPPGLAPPASFTLSAPRPPATAPAPTSPPQATPAPARTASAAATPAPAPQTAPAATTPAPAEAVPPAPRTPPAPPGVPPGAPLAPPPTARRGPVAPVGSPPAPGLYPPPPGAPRIPLRHDVPETPAETTTRLRPVRPRQRWRTVTAAACVVLGLGLIGGAATGAWLTGDSSAETTTSPYTAARAAWHSVPVDTLFPRTLEGRGAGPGGTHRTWTRIAVAADSPCADGLDPLLLTTLRSVGCERLVRATYTDATRSAVTTVGLVFTEADAAGMQALRTRFTEQKLGARKDLMPRTYAPEGTPVASFGAGQRASWTVDPLTELPVVVLAVSGFADGRAVAEPQPAADAMASGAATDIAQAGLGHEAKGVADRVERGLRAAVADLTEQPG